MFDFNEAIAAHSQEKGWTHFITHGSLKYNTLQRDLHLAFKMEIGSC